MTVLMTGGSMNLQDKDFYNKIKEKWYFPLVNEARFLNRKQLLVKLDSENNPQLINELILANLILNNKDFICEQLLYEPKPDALKNSAKSIDFRFIMEKKDTVYCDVKTIRPEIKDSWEKFKNDQGYFPENIKVELDKKWMGGEIYHCMRNARASMLQYAIELEDKIEAYSKSIKTHYVLIFCGNGFHWHLDEFEDFADFYLTGKHNPGDQFCNMENYYIQSEKIVFQKTINRFAYFEHKEYEIDYRKFVCPVRGPWVTGRWKSI